MARLPSFLRSPMPFLGLEIAADRVAAVRLAPDARSVTAWAAAPLRPGVVSPALAATNITAPEEVTAVIRDVVGQVGGRDRRVALVIPDTAAKVSFLRFEQVPARAADLEQLVRWQVRKTMPFPVEQAQVSIVDSAPQADGGRELVVTVVRRDIVEEYERVCAAAGLHAGVVDLSTFNLLNLAWRSAGIAPAGRADDLSASAAGDLLLVHAARDYATVAIVRGEHLLVFRTRPQDEETPVTDLVHQTAMYYEDRLNGRGFSRALVLSDPGVAQTGEMQRALEARLGAPFEPLTLADLRVRDRVTIGPELAATIAAPAGLVLRLQQAG